MTPYKSASSPSQYSGDPAAAHVLEAGFSTTWPTAHPRSVIGFFLATRANSLKALRYLPPPPAGRATFTIPLLPATVRARALASMIGTRKLRRGPADINISFADNVIQQHGLASYLP